MCPNSNICFAIGSFTDLINFYFDNMSYKNAIEPIRPIGLNSVNGFIREVTHEKDGYFTKTLLKSSRHEYSDNLMYEYLVGQYINKLNKKFPCFLHTYACYKYDSIGHYNKFARNKQNVQELNKLKLLHTSTQLTTPSKFKQIIKNSCEINKMACISIQYFENAISLFELVKKNVKDIQFMEHEFIYLLAQICIPLGILSKTFTHNDLHAENVLIYTIPNNKFVTMTYNTHLGVITFKTKYICKIVDYGRSYFSDTAANINSSQVINSLCGTPACGVACTKSTCIKGDSGMNACGKNVGYGFSDHELTQANYNTSILINNSINDMGLIHFLANYIYQSSYNLPPPQTLGHSISLEIIKKKHDYYTINKFSDVYIRFLLNNPDVKDIEKRYPTMSNLDEYGSFMIDATHSGNECNEYKFLIKPAKAANKENAKIAKDSRVPVKKTRIPVKDSRVPVKKTRVPVCKTNYELNNNTNKCIKSCTQFQVRNTKTNRCNIVKNTKTKRKINVCPSNKEWYAPKRRCRVSCTLKQHRNQITQRCNNSK